MNYEKGMGQKNRSPIVSNVAAIILIIFSAINILSTSNNVPKFGDLKVANGVLESVENISTAKPYLKICLESGGCYKYPSRSKSWRNANKIILKGGDVKVWYLESGDVSWLWQFEHDGKLLLSYKLLKWEIDNERKLASIAWKVLFALGLFVFILTMLKMINKNREKGL